MTLTDPSAIQDLLQRHGFRFSKAMGQNFLINPSVCPRMAEACGAGPGRGVLEIGPGIGVLTEQLALRADKVVAVELDRRLPPLLAETLAAYPHVEIVQGDILKMDLPLLLKEKFGSMPVSVCANLPYYITSPIVMTLLESRLPIDNLTVMVQKEAAQRLCARPGTREAGAVTLAVQYYARPEILFPVSRGSFLPAPNVDSAVIRLTIRREPPCSVRDEAVLFRAVRAAFGQRRKTLLNSLCSGGWEKAAVAQALKETGLAPTARAEELALEDFARLANRLSRPA